MTIKDKLSDAQNIDLVCEALEFLANKLAEEQVASSVIGDESKCEEFYSKRVNCYQIRQDLKFS